MVPNPGCGPVPVRVAITDRSRIKYLDLQSLYPNACTRKHYPVGHPRCLIGPNFRGLDVNSYEGFIKCKVLPPKGLRIPLLPCHINGKLMFILYRACAETMTCGVCGHTCSERCLTGTWVSVELQKAVVIRYVIVAIYEACNYVRTHEEISLSHGNIKYNAGRRTVVKLSQNNIWGKFAQNPDRCTNSL